MAASSFVTCEYCKTTYKAFARSIKRGTRFCSRKCKYAAMRTEPEIPKFIEQTCPICGIIFPARWEATIQKRQQCCSNSCRSKLFGLRHRGDQNPIYKARVPCTCTACGKSFTKYPSRVHTARGNKADFCSRHCSTVHNHSVRKKRTGIEVGMARLLTEAGIPFREQVSMYDRWVVDFVIDDWNLIVFCDGVYWHSKPKVAAKDRGQTRYLEKCGWNVLRFDDDDINNTPQSCLFLIELFAPR